MQLATIAKLILDCQTHPRPIDILGSNQNGTGGMVLLLIGGADDPSKTAMLAAAMRFPAHCLLFAGLAAAVGLSAQQSVPSTDVPSGAHRMLRLVGKGAQVYTCTDGGWTLKAPDAKLFDSAGNSVGTHFAGPSWKLADGSEVKGKAVASRPSSEAGAVPWLLLESMPGSGSGQFANVAYVRRTETHGGVSPPGGCAKGAADIRVPYSAVYEFYAK